LSEVIPPRLRTADLARHLRHVALDLYERDGFDAVTADVLANESGVNRRSLFRYFSTLDDVVFSDHHIEIQPQVQQRLADAAGTVPTVAAALVPVLECFAVDEDFVRRRQRIVSCSTVLHDREQLWFGLYRTSVAERLREVATSTIERAMAAVVAAALVAALGEVLDAWYQDESVDALAFFRQLTALISSIEERSTSGRDGPGHQHLRVEQALQPRLAGREAGRGER